MNRVKQQHYVPQYYLRNFANSSERLWVFDKTTQKSFWAHTSKIAQERAFYDPPAPFLTVPGVEVNGLEKQFASLEAAAQPITDAFIAQILCASVDDIVLNEGMRAALSVIVALQILRTRAARDWIKTQGAALLAGLCPQELKDAGWDDEQYRSFLQSPPAQYLQHLSWLEHGAQALMCTIRAMKWQVGNSSGSPLCTSDNPVVRSGRFFGKGVTFDGILTRNAEIAYPLSPRVVLIMRDHGNPRHVGADGALIDLSERETLELNSAQMWQSNKQIFFSENSEQFAQSRLVIGDALRTVLR